MEGFVLANYLLFQFQKTNEVHGKQSLFKPVTASMNHTNIVVVGSFVSRNF